MVKLVVTFAILFLLPLIGAFGFMALEGWSFLDALYQSVITLSTIGFHVVSPLSDASKLFMLVFVVVGLPFFLFSLVEMGGMIVQGEVRTIIKGYLMDKKIQNLSDHYIVCGAGRMGRAVCENLETMNMPFVLLDNDEKVINELKTSHDWIFLLGDATEDSTLLAAGIHKSKFLAAVLQDDSSNVFVTLSARMLRPDLSIISRSSNEEASSKLIKAGANQIVSPYTSGALKLTQLMANPDMNEFMEIISDREVPLDLTVIAVGNKDQFVAKSISELGLREKGVVLVGVIREGGDMLLPPQAHDQVEENDRLIAVGSPEALQTFGRVA